MIDYPQRCFPSMHKCPLSEYLRRHPPPREVPEVWVSALTPRPMARWMARIVWCFPVLLGLLLAGTAQWEARQIARTLSDFHQTVLPSPDIRRVEATILSVDTHTRRKHEGDFLRVTFRYTAANGSAHIGEGYFVRRDLPPTARITVRHLDNNPAIAIPEGGSRGLPGFWGAIGWWIALTLLTALARPLIHAADRAEVRRILREGALHGDRVVLGSGSRIITLTGLQRSVDKLPEGSIR